MTRVESGLHGPVRESPTVRGAPLVFNTNGFITLQNLKEKLNTANVIHEYKLVLDSIPKRWRYCIKQIVDPNWKRDNLSFTWNDKKYSYHDLKNITCKCIYSFLLEKKAKQANSEQSWNLYFQTNVDWFSVWIYQTTNLTCHMRLVEFNFKILHNILPSGTFLHKWKLSNSGLCILCKTPDDYEHMFISCYYVKSFWSKVTTLIYKSFNIMFNVNYKHVVLGYNDSSRDGRNSRVINIVISIAKYVIFKVWCKHKSDKNTFLVAKRNLYNIFKSDVKFYSEIEKTNLSKYSDILEQVCLNL